MQLLEGKACHAVGRLIKRECWKTRMRSGYMVQEQCMAGYAATTPVRGNAQLETAIEILLCEATIQARARAVQVRAEHHLVVILLQKALHQGRPLLQALLQPLRQVRAPSLQACAATCVTLPGSCLPGRQSNSFTRFWQSLISGATKSVAAKHADVCALACRWRPGKRRRGVCTPLACAAVRARTVPSRWSGCSAHSPQTSGPPQSSAH